MPRLTQDQWQSVRAEREAGATFDSLAAKFGVSKTAIVKKSNAEGWGDGSDLAEIIRRKVTEKVTGIVTSQNPVKKAQAIDAAADRGAEVIKRHQDEPNAIRALMYSGVKASRDAVTKEEKQLAFETVKAATQASICMVNIHKLERQAHGLDAVVESGNDDLAAVAAEARRRLGV